MLTKEQIENNKNEFLNLLAGIDIEGADIQGLTDYLLSTDFFTAPASTQYHCNFEGGLCYHSLNVYKNLANLVDIYANVIPAYSESTLLTVGLLHDLSKVNFYEPSVVNKKKYYPEGSKHDNLGNFDWFSEESYKVKEAKLRNILGNHEEASALLVGRYIPLNIEETIAIMHHHCNTNDGSQFYDLTPMLNANPLLTLLHTADYLSCFLIERDR